MNDSKKIRKNGSISTEFPTFGNIIFIAMPPTLLAAYF